MIPGVIGWKVGISELPIRDVESAGAVITAAGVLGGVAIVGSQLSAAAVAAQSSTAVNQGLMLAGGAISHGQGVALSTALRVVASAEAIPLVGEFTGGVAKGFAQGLGVARFAPSGGLVEAADRTVGYLPFAINQQLKNMTGTGVASWF
jgi:hypothetical protein